MPEPIHFVISESSFDLSQIPQSARSVGSDSFRQHVAQYFRKQYEHLDGDTTVEFKDGNIVVTWIPRVADRAPMDAIVELLKAGNYTQAAPMLMGLLQANPNDPDALYNLGMVYSDQGRLDEARELLRRAIKVAPNFANALVALGVAALRAKDMDEARSALERAVMQEPGNPYALRTLGSLLGMKGDASGAVGYLRRAISVSPEDPIALLTLAQMLIEIDPAANTNEADGLLHKVLQIVPHGDLAEKAKNALRAMASQTFRKQAVSGIRPDAMMYCLDALKRFEGMSQAELGPILLEMANLGQSGLPVNDPDKKYTLRSMPGEFTALNIVCMMHVGIKKIDPGMGSGFDIDKEYEAALSMYKSEKGT